MKLDSYKDAGLLVSEALVNELDSNDERDVPAPAREAVATLSRILAIDPPSVAQLTQAHVPAFALARVGRALPHPCTCRTIPCRRHAGWLV